MSNFHTNLIVSQKIASLGVKAESDKYWVDGEILQRQPDKYTLIGDEIYPAFNLAELADVLREVGKIKGWPIYNVQMNFTEVCISFFQHGESAANKYLEEIL